MLLSYSFIVLICTAGLIKGEDEERVWLHDENNDHESRHFDIGLPENLAFTLQRDSGSMHKLSLNQNKRLNLNAPVYEAVPDRNGMQRLVERSSTPMLTTKFYHDKNMGAAVKVTCNNQVYGACQRSLEGSLNIDGESYEIKPSLAQIVRAAQPSNAVPHTIRKVVPPPLPLDLPDTRGYPGATYQSIKDAESTVHDGGVPVPDEEESRGYDDGILPGNSTETIQEMLRSLINMAELDRAVKKMQSDHSRKKRQSTDALAVEILGVVDPMFWKKYYDAATGANDAERSAAAELYIREKLAHVVNGISLRYESIEDPDLNMYVTLSGILFYKV